jgi:ABC-type oligopeptide transport system substrate-binding subunit
MKRFVLALLMVALTVSAFAGQAAPEAAAQEVVFKLNNGTEPESLDPALSTWGSSKASSPPILRR